LRRYRRPGLLLRDDTDPDPEEGVETEKRLKEDFHPQGRTKSRHDGLIEKEKGFLCKMNLQP